MSSPARDTVNPPTSSKGGDDDVVIIGHGFTTPGNPVALSKHTAKEEFAAMGKGKGKADLSSVMNLGTNELHSGYLNRLYTRRDYEAGLVNLMKERNEVILKHCNLCLAMYINSYCSSQGPVYLLKTNRVL